MWYVAGAAHSKAYPANLALKCSDRIAAGSYDGTDICVVDIEIGGVVRGEDGGVDTRAGE